MGGDKAYDTYEIDASGRPADGNEFILLPHKLVGALVKCRIDGGSGAIAALCRVPGRS